MNEISQLNRWAMILIVSGLLVEIGSLFALHHALGFMAFLFGGCTLMVLGILLFMTRLLQLVRERTPEGT